MNQIIESLKTRRSVRSYTDRQISDEDLREILTCGTLAPSGMGMQSPLFAVVQDPELIKTITEIHERISEEENPYYGAPTLIIVFADTDVSTYIYDGSTALCNMLNAAHALGLGSCWIHCAKKIFESPEGCKLKEEWQIPERFEGIGTCIVGYAKEVPEGPDPRKDDYVRMI